MRALLAWATLLHLRLSWQAWSGQVAWNQQFATSACRQWYSLRAFGHRLDLPGLPRLDRLYKVGLGRLYQVGRGLDGPGFRRLALNFFE